MKNALVGFLLIICFLSCTRISYPIESKYLVVSFHKFFTTYYITFEGAQTIGKLSKSAIEDRFGNERSFTRVLAFMDSCGYDATHTLLNRGPFVMFLTGQNNYEMIFERRSAQPRYIPPPLRANDMLENN